ncbi:MAG: PP2C family protein-serine/threonine phosphatase [Terriglobales bacterium]
MSALPPSVIWARIRQGWSTRSRLGASAVFLAAVEIVLVIVREIQQKLTGQPTLGGWIFLVGACLCICLLAMGFRWFRKVVMWRLRNRLIVTYGFIGVIPVVLLLAIGVIAAYLFAGQFATFVVTSDLQTELKSVEGANQAAAGVVAVQVAAGAPLEKAVQGLQGESLHTTVWLVPAKGTPKAATVPATAQVIPLPATNQPPGGAAIAGDENGVHLRAWTTETAGPQRLVAISSKPVDQALLATLANNFGEITFNAPDFSQPHDKPGEARVDTQFGWGSSAGSGKQGQRGVVMRDGQVYTRTPGTGELVRAKGAINAGRLTPALGRWDREVWFGTPFQVMGWESGQNTVTVLGVRTRPSLLYGRLFRALGEFASIILYLLAGICVFFALIELIALITGIRLTRTMTRSIAALYDATQHINRGDLSHRIEVVTRDQLAALEQSFNSMTESLEKLIAEQKEKQRIQSELAIAQEVQAQLFPRDTSSLASLDVHGICRPARTVSGDYYDFLQLGAEKLGIAVGDISGKGISAALLMATIHSAVRVYEFGRMPAHEELVAAGAAAAAMASGSAKVTAAGAIQSPAIVLSLLNRHLFHSTPPEKYATLFLGLWDGDTRTLTYSNGGHLPPLVIRNDGTVRKLEAGGTVIGLFDEMAWDEDDVVLESGDLFVAFSDGVTEPENEFGEFGEHRLIEIVKENRHEPLARIAEAVVGAVNDWIGGNEQPDDVTLVLARARK